MIGGDVVLVCLASVKGSPGVTTLGVALAARWPSHWQRVLVEADPAGGDLAARYDLALTPGLVSLAAAARRNTERELVAEHAQRLPGGLPAVLGPARPDQAQAALAALCGSDGRAGVLGAYRGVDRAVAVVDCGRLDGRESPIRAVLGEADQVLVVARPRADELAHLAARADEIAAGPARTRLVLVGSGYPAGDVEREVGLSVAATIPWDSGTAGALAGHGQSRRPSLRSRLIRAATRLAAELASDPRRYPPSALATVGAGGPNPTPPVVANSTGAPRGSKR